MQWNYHKWQNVNLRHLTGHIAKSNHPESADEVSMLSLHPSSWKTIEATNRNKSKTSDCNWMFCGSPMQSLKKWGLNMADHIWPQRQSHWTPLTLFHRRFWRRHLPHFFHSKLFNPGKCHGPNLAPFYITFLQAWSSQNRWSRDFHQFHSIPRPLRHSTNLIR